MSGIHKVGVAMSGGSTKGAWQAGALLALEELGLLKNATYFSGTSVGAINAAAMTSLNAKQMCDLYSSLNKTSDVFKAQWWKLWSFDGLYSLDPIRKLLWSKLDPSNPRGVEAVACAISMKDTRFMKGYWSNQTTLDFSQWFEKVMASATIPFFMAPHRTGLWFDGGLREFIPVRETVRRCEKVYAIATTPVRSATHEDLEYKWPRGLWYGIHTVDKAMQREIMINDYLKECESANVIRIHPLEPLKVGTFEVKRSTMLRLIDEGHARVMELLG